MNLLDQRGVTDDDLNRYLGNCIVFDRAANAPALVTAITSRAITLAHYINPLATVDQIVGPNAVPKVTYTPDKASYLYDMDSYALPEAGWRQLGDEAVHLGRVLVNNGVRGIPPDRLRVTRICDLYPSVGYNYRALFGTRVHAHQIIPLIFSIPNLPIKEAINRVKSGYACAVSSEVCVVPVVTPASTESRYVIYHDTYVIGVGVGNKITMLHEKLIHLLGDINGLDVNCKGR